MEKTNGYNAGSTKDIYSDAKVENTGVKLDNTLNKLYVAFKDPNSIQWEFYMV